jgi:hypothetical protein
MIERIIHNDVLLSIIIRSSFEQDGIEFFTPDDFSQQLAYMKRPKNYSIAPHFHNPIPREVVYTEEVLFVKSGKVRVDFYDDQCKYFESKILNRGDVILLSHGGHGLKMIEQSEIIEVKQGPYLQDKDKTRFEGIGTDEVVFD